MAVSKATHDQQLSSPRSASLARLSELQAPTHALTPHVEHNDTSSKPSAKASTAVGQVPPVLPNKVAKPVKRSSECTAMETSKRRRDNDSTPALASAGDYDLEAEYAFMAPTQYQAAITGRLRPDLLHAVLDPAGSFYRPVSAHTTHPVQRFLAGIPDSQTFCVAWGSLKVLMTCQEDGDWEENCKVGRYMTQYMGFILECSVLYTWESIARFHVRAMGPVFAAGALRAERWRGWDRGRDLIVLERLP